MSSYRLSLPQRSHEAPGKLKLEAYAEEDALCLELGEFTAVERSSVRPFSAPSLAERLESSRGFTCLNKEEEEYFELLDAAVVGLSSVSQASGRVTSTYKLFSERAAALEGVPIREADRKRDTPEWEYYDRSKSRAIGDEEFGDKTLRKRHFCGDYRDGPVKIPFDRVRSSTAPIFRGAKEGFGVSRPPENLASADAPVSRFSGYASPRATPVTPIGLSAPSPVTWTALSPPPLIRSSAYGTPPPTPFGEEMGKFAEATAMEEDPIPSPVDFNC